MVRGQPKTVVSRLMINIGRRRLRTRTNFSESIGTPVARESFPSLPVHLASDSSTSLPDSLSVTYIDARFLSLSIVSQEDLSRFLSLGCIVVPRAFVPGEEEGRRGRGSGSGSGDGGGEESVAHSTPESRFRKQTFRLNRRDTRKTTERVTEERYRAAQRKILRTRAPLFPLLYPHLPPPFSSLLFASSRIYRRDFLRGFLVPRIDFVGLLSMALPVHPCCCSPSPSPTLRLLIPRRGDIVLIKGAVWYFGPNIEGSL